MINVLIADDHTLLTDSLSIILKEEIDIQVVAIAHDGKEALEKCKRYKPDVVLLDIKMPELNGIEATGMIKESCPDTKVAILTSLEEGKNVLNSLITGADAYLLKDTSPERLTAVIKCIHWGFYILSGNTKQLFQDEILSCKGIKTGNTIEPLAVEEREIIRYISEGKSNRDIAEILGYAEGTIKNKITKILKTAAVETRAQLVIFALKNNLL